MRRLPPRQHTQTHTAAQAVARTIEETCMTNPYHGKEDESLPKADVCVMRSRDAVQRPAGRSPRSAATLSARPMVHKRCPIGVHGSAFASVAVGKPTFLQNAAKRGSFR